jgi:hypothetical protein
MMADTIQLLHAAIQAVESGANDLAIDFAQRAIQELGGETRSERPWSSHPRDGERFVEFLRRSVGFLESFASAPQPDIPEDRARALAHEFFPEEPRVVGPSFYRIGSLETLDGPTGRTVRLTERGQKHLKKVQKMASQFERRTAVY